MLFNPTDPKSAAYNPLLEVRRGVHEVRDVQNIADILVDAPTSQLETFNRRKLLLACLLMRRPSLLLLDEPAAGLINSEIDEIDSLLRILSKEMNVAIVIVEHRIELLGTIADRVIVMDAGEVISEGLMDDVMADPKVHAAYFEDFSEQGHS